MSADKMQLQRFELKYLISEEQAWRARDFVSSYLRLDEFGETQEETDYAYPVHSLYLDSPDLRLFQETINGTKNRFKLRLRYYEDRPDAPVYFEIKRRINNVIAKQRGGVRREAVELLLSGHMPEESHMLSKEPKHLFAVQRFCELLNELHATPKTHVSYLREAYLSEFDNSVRVTFDRQVMTDFEPTARLLTTMVRPVKLFDSVILELKFTTRFPDWFQHLVQVLGVMQCGAAKYVEGVYRLRSELVAGGVDVPTLEDARWRAKRLKKVTAALA